MVFNEIAEGFGGVLGQSPEVGGYLAGTIFLICMMIIIYYASESENLAMMTGAGIAGFNSLVGWFPIWIIVFLAFILALMLIRPFSGNDE